jgi:hypothetical protein
MAIDANRERIFEPSDKSGDEVLVEIRPKAWAFLFERVVPKFCRYRLGITAKVEKVSGDQCAPILPCWIGYGIESACESFVVAVFSQG